MPHRLDDCTGGIDGHDRRCSRRSPSSVSARTPRAPSPRPRRAVPTWSSASWARNQQVHAIPVNEPWPGPARPRSSRCSTWSRRCTLSRNRGPTTVPTPSRRPSATPTSAHGGASAASSTSPSLRRGPIVKGVAVISLRGTVAENFLVAIINVGGVGYLCGVSASTSAALRARAPGGGPHPHLPPGARRRAIALRLCHA